jgi:ABC-2 type transport system ATP-binding protein
VPGVRGVTRSYGAGEDITALDVDHDVDEQAVLTAAQAAGPVTHFAIVRPTLTELFREAVNAA